MSNLKRRRIKQAVLESDKESLLGVSSIAAYKPTNTLFATDKISALMTDMVAKQNASFTAKGTYENLADAAQDAEQAFHEAILGMRKQVVAQFGDDSPEVRLIGMKRRSDYKKPTRKKEKAKT
jgi:hypothetical protein